MTNARSVFNTEQLKILDSIGAVLDDDTDYDYESLMDFHDIITDNYLSQFTNGEPNSTALIYEQIIDLFYDVFEI